MGRYRVFGNMHGLLFTDPAIETSQVAPDRREVVAAPQDHPLPVAFWTCRGLGARLRDNPHLAVCPVVAPHPRTIQPLYLSAQRSDMDGHPPHRAEHKKARPSNEIRASHERLREPSGRSIVLAGADGLARVSLVLPIFRYGPRDEQAGRSNSRSRHEPETHLPTDTKSQ